MGKVTESKAVGAERKDPWLWIVVLIVTALIAVRLLVPFELADPHSGEANSKQHFIALEQLPDGWTTKWSTDAKSALRLQLVSPGRDAIVEVLTFDGDLDRDKFDQIGALLYGSKFPPPDSKITTTEYDRTVQRLEFEAPENDGQVVYLTIDVFWHESRKDYAFVVISKSLQENTANAQAARASLRFYPPSLTAIGRVGSRIVHSLDFGEHWIAIGSWLAAICWGLWYVIGSLRAWKPAKYLLVTGLSAGALVAHGLFSVSWWSTLSGITFVIIMVGAGAALLSGEWKLED